MVDADFKTEVERAIRLYEREIGPAATRTRPMIEGHGEIETLSRLMIQARVFPVLSPRIRF